MIFPVLQTYGLDSVLNYCASNSTCPNKGLKGWYLSGTVQCPSIRRFTAFDGSPFFHQFDCIHVCSSMQVFSPSNCILLSRTQGVCDNLQAKLQVFFIEYRCGRENTVYNAKKHALLGHCHHLLKFPFLVPVCWKRKACILAPHMETIPKQHFGIEFFFRAGINVFKWVNLQEVLISALSEWNYGFQVENELKFPSFFFVLLLSSDLFMMTAWHNWVLIR